MPSAVFVVDAERKVRGNADGAISHPARRQPQRARSRIAVNDEDRFHGNSLPPDRMVDGSVAQLLSSGRCSVAYSPSPVALVQGDDGGAGLHQSQQPLEELFGVGTCEAVESQCGQQRQATSPLPASGELEAQGTKRSKAQNVGTDNACRRHRAFQ